jgi:RNA polymerase sigma-70 factor, ECF subfamily
MADTPGFTRQDLEAIYSSESRRVFASLVRLLGDLDLAEEALQDAFIAALEQWPGAGIPANARAWLISVGRFRAIDRLRRRARFDKAHADITDVLYAQSQVDTEAGNGVADDRLGLIFICCHPAISADAQVALTLREVCGLTTEEIARAFLTATATIAQRVVRAKLKIREAHIPFEAPPLRDITGRLAAVLRVIYLVFSEGYWASAGASVTRCDLSAEAIRLGRLLAELLREPEVKGLLALMLFHESRRTARVSTGGKPVLSRDNLDENGASIWVRRGGERKDN